ncbi:MAG: AAA family ATPase [Deinococcales bacterium]
MLDSVHRLFDVFWGKAVEVEGLQDEVVFGRWLRRRRRALDLTQKTLARRAGCSAATIRKLEADERRPSRHVAAALARALDVPPGEHESFVRFARGGWSDRPPAVWPGDLERPWRALALEASEAIAASPASLPRSGPKARQGEGVASSAGSARIVSREHELERLSEGLEQTLAGRGGVLFVAGEAGQGKTTLLRSFAERAQAVHPELLVAAGACNAYTGTGDPFQPFREVLEELVGPEHAGVRPPPWLAARVAQATVHEGLAGSSHAAVRSAISTLVTGVAGAAPLLLLLDDLQWLDESSADALLHLARSIMPYPVLLLGAFRPSDIVLRDGTPRHVLYQVLHEVERVHGEAVVDLDRADGRAFLEAWLDSEPNRLDAAFRDALWRQTGGQPLFTIELLRAMQERGELVKDVEGRWTLASAVDWAALPDRVAGVLGERIGRLDPFAREVLRVASVEGETFTAEVVAQILERAPRGVTRVVGDELHRRRQLVVPVETRRGATSLVSRYRFRHNLIQRYVYEAIDEAERGYLHEAVGDALQKLLGEEADPVALADHYLRARAPWRAAPHLRRAGDRARESGALSQAVHYYQAALEHWPDAEPIERATLLRSLGECECARGSLDVAFDALREARALCRDAGDGRTESAVLALMGHVLYERQDYARGLDACTSAIEALDGGPPCPELAVALSMRSLLYMMQGEDDRPLADGRRALAMADALHAEDARLRALLTVGTVLCRPGSGRLEEGLAMLEQSFRAADRMGIDHFASASLGNRASSFVAMGRLDESQEAFQRALDYARSRGVKLHEGMFTAGLWSLLWRRGRWAEALERAAELRQLAAETPRLDRNSVFILIYLASSELDLGRPEDAAATLDTHMASLERLGEAQTAEPYLRERLRIAAMGGRPEEADRRAAALVASLEDRPRHDPDAVLTTCRWLTRRPSVEAARGVERCLAVLAEMARQDGHRLARAASHEARSVVADARGDAAEASRLARVAADEWGATGLPLDEARARSLAAHALRRAGRELDGESELQRARELLDALSGELSTDTFRASFAQVRRTMLEGAGSVP